MKNMKTTKEIQTSIFEQTRIKVSAKKMTGSMKHYYSFKPKEGKKFDMLWLWKFTELFKAINKEGAPYLSSNELNIHINHIKN